MNAYCEPLRIKDSDLKINIYSYLANQFSIHPHWHEACEILYMIRGSIGVHLEDSFYILSAGEMTIIGKDQIHSTYEAEQGENEILVFHISNDFIDCNILSDEDKYLLRMLMENNILFPNVLSDKEDGISETIEYIFKIYKEFSHKDKAHGILIKAYVLAMAGILVRNFGSNIKKPQSNKSTDIAKSMLIRTFKLIDNSYCEKITLSDAANTSHLSVSHFCRLFKKTTGMTFNDYLTSYRIKMAEKLLSSEHTLSDIAHKCGFESISSFIRAFKKFKNITPSEFRNKFFKV